MSKRHLIAVLLFLSLLGGCAVAPQTFEESLSTPRAVRNDIRDWDNHLRYMVGLQYANAARKTINQPSIDIPQTSSRDIQIPFAIWDFSIGDNLAGGIGVLDWFNAGMNGANHTVYYYNRGLGFMANPNTHYFAFDEGDGEATETDVRDMWSSANKMFEAVFNKSGDCHVWGYSESMQYSGTNSKDVPGRYKEVLYRCPNPVFEGQVLRVNVSAWANPFSDDVQVIGAVQSQCTDKKERGERFADTRFCGEQFAALNRTRLDLDGRNWMEMIITPAQGSPSLLEVVVDYKGSTRTLPPPEPNPDYTDFLASRPYPGSN